MAVVVSACGDNDGIVLDAPLVIADGPLAVADGPLAVADSRLADATPDAPPSGADAALPDAFDADAALTVVKEFTFATDTDGYTVTFADVGTGMTWHSDDGDPPGSLAFTATLTDSTPVAVKATFTSAVTWETWGVPPGAQVIALRVKGYKGRLASISGDIDHHWSFQIVNPQNQLVHDGIDGGYLEFASLTRTVQDSWETFGPRDSFAVLAPYRASNQQLYPKIWYFPLNAGSIDWRLDELQLEITYLNP